jgi:hypothetical protein
MTTSWVSGVVRAKALGRRRLGRAGARALAGSPSLQEAVATLVETPYGHDMRVGFDLSQAQRAVGDSLLWNVRVLSGWLPASGSEALRVLAGWCEIANVDEMLRELDRTPAESPYRLGTLATAWPQLAGSTSVADLRERLGHSAWGEPGGESRRDIQPGMRLVWADRVATRVPQLQSLAVGATALLLAREAVGSGRLLSAALTFSAARLVGREAAGARTLAELAAALPASARWAFEGVTEQADVWAAETRWWLRLEEQSFALARTGNFTAGPVLGAVGLLAVDAWRVRAALALSGCGGAGEVLDAVA